MNDLLHIFKKQILKNPISFDYLHFLPISFKNII